MTQFDIYQGEEYYGCEYGQHESEAIERLTGEPCPDGFTAVECDPEYVA